MVASAAGTFLGASAAGTFLRSHHRRAALALVFFSANYLNPFYQTLSVLVFAYAIRFLPEALGATRAAIFRRPASITDLVAGLEVTAR